MSKIENRMEDRGNGRHIGCWTDNIGECRQSLLIAIFPDVVTIACCEDANPQRRYAFVTNRQKAIEITRAMALALGLTIGEPTP